MEYERLIYKLGSLHSLLKELAENDLYQGEQTIVYAGQDGKQEVVHVYIDGTDLQMSKTPLDDSDLNFSLDAYIDD